MDDWFAKESAGQTSALESTAGCCGASASLHDLDYVWPAGFGRFVLEALNPQPPDLAPDQQALLEAALGCRLRKVWAHH